VQKRLQKLIQAATEKLYAATHRRPPPTFVRVAYLNPRRVVLLTTRSGGREDVWPIDWHTPLSLEPDRYGVCLYRGGHGTALLREAGCFVVHFVPADWEKAILTCGNTSGRDKDKFELAGLAREEAETVDAPRLAGALGYLECEVERCEELGDRLLVLGRVKKAVLAPPAAELHHVSTDAPEAR
jgi:flavin reductase (DIM6/NTAB) family NADH-FMN oxidoreductase RutF